MSGALFPILLCFTHTFEDMIYTLKIEMNENPYMWRPLTVLGQMRQKSFSEFLWNFHPSSLKTTPNCISGRETSRSDFKIESPCIT